MSEIRPLHRLFGLSWIDFFQGTPIIVETELDLSLKQQFIDLVLIRKGRGRCPDRCPDGFEDLAAHNLITFKSHQEALDPWALWELVGHFVNYRKQASPSLNDLLPEGRFSAVRGVRPLSAFNLAQQVALTPLRAGVYEVQGLALRIRVIVANQLPLEEHNAMLHLFSAREELAPLRTGTLPAAFAGNQLIAVVRSILGLYSEESRHADKLKEFVRWRASEKRAYPWRAWKVPRRNAWKVCPRNSWRGDSPPDVCGKRWPDCSKPTVTPPNQTPNQLTGRASRT